MSIKGEGGEVVKYVYSNGCGGDRDSPQILELSIVKRYENEYAASEPPGGVS